MRRLWLGWVMLAAGVGQAQTAAIPFSDARIRLLGRTAAEPDGSVRLGYPGTGFVLHTAGTSAVLRVRADSPTSALTVVVDDALPRLRMLASGENRVWLMEGLAGAGPHVVRVYKRTETWQGVVRLEGLDLEKGDGLLEAVAAPRRRLMFLGDSVTCGAGVARNDRCLADPFVPANDAYNSYGMVLGRRLDAETHLVCYGGRGVVRDWRGLGVADGVLNAPEFLDLAIATDDAKQRSGWKPESWQPDAVVVSLGTNDFTLQGTKPLVEKDFVGAYADLLRRVAKEYPRARIVATEGAIVTNPLLGRYVQAAVDAVGSPRVVRVAATHYPGNGCDGHPTRDQQRQMTDELEGTLRGMLTW